MVNIILATYNGEKYIEQQLLSLMAQTYTKWKCIIHDDGSKDKTVKIIKKYQKLDSRFVLIEDKISNKNAGKNFLHTLKFGKADYFCFCDQDDIWLDNKLQKLVNAIEKKDNSIPQVVFCNAHCFISSEIPCITFTNSFGCSFTAQCLQPFKITTLPFGKTSSKPSKSLIGTSGSFSPFTKTTGIVN